MQILAIYVLLALAAAMAILVAKKTGLLEKLTEKVSNLKLLYEMMCCDLCISFWLILLLSVFVCIFTNDIRVLLAALFSTPITRMLL